MKQLLINSEELETRVALVEDGKLEDYFIERTGEQRLAGSIFKGRVRNLEPSLQAAFVDIGVAKNAFLHYWDMLPATKEMLEDGEVTVRPPPPVAGPGPESVESSKKAGGRPRSLMERLARKLFKHEEPAAAPEANPPRAPRRPRQVRQPRRAPPATIEDIPLLFKVNSEVLVQVSKGPIGSKGARVTTNLSIPGRYLVLLPNSTHVGVSKRIADRQERDRLRQILRRLKLPPGMGVICRTVGEGVTEQHFQQDLAILLSYWEKAEESMRTRRAPCCVYQEPGLVERALRDVLTEDIDEIVTDSRDVFDLARDMSRRFSRREKTKVRLHTGAKPLFRKYRLTEQIEHIFRRQVPLPSGGYIAVDETEALVAIDVNSGKNRAGKDHPETILTTNIEACEEVARQLRLRNVGGLIVVDFIDMRAKRDRNTVYRTFRQFMSRDRARTRILPISSLGLIEMTRQREEESVRNTVFSPCPYCNGRGLIKSATSVSVEIQRRIQELLRRRKGRLNLRVSVHPNVLVRLKNEDAELLHKIEEDLGGRLSFRADTALHMEEFRITDLDAKVDL
ncbi:MAG: Rne/Rng family ribonuclease [Kiritimatiellaeota bacterium]|nr:Rne/Rng family ribonuclease [Kiritimatiellota bacterium]